MSVPTMQIRQAKKPSFRTVEFSLRLGHARVLTPHRGVIHCARAASLRRPLQTIRFFSLFFSRKVLAFFLMLDNENLFKTVGTDILGGPPVGCYYLRTVREAGPYHIPRYGSTLERRNKPDLCFLGIGRVIVL